MNNNYGYAVIASDEARVKFSPKLKSDEHMCGYRGNTWQPCLSCDFTDDGIFTPEMNYRRLLVSLDDPEWELVPWDGIADGLLVHQHTFDGLNWVNTGFMGGCRIDAIFIHQPIAVRRWKKPVDKLVPVSSITGKWRMVSDKIPPYNTPVIAKFIGQQANDVGTFAVLTPTAEIKNGLWYDKTTHDGKEVQIYCWFEISSYTPAPAEPDLRDVAFKDAVARLGMAKMDESFIGFMNAMFIAGAQYGEENKK